MTGSSMLPIFRDGDELIVEPRPPFLRLGDVILYRHAGRSIVHRLVGRRSGDETLLLKGDCLVGFDPPLHIRKVLGRVVERRSASGITDFDSLSWQRANTVIASLSASIGDISSLFRGGRRTASHNFTAVRRLTLGK